MSSPLEIEDYNEEPIQYCKRCLSLKIKHEDAVASDYCGDCGCTDIQEASIYEWENLYRIKYKHDFIKKTDNYGHSIYYNMPIKKLKMKLYNSLNCEFIIKTLYPNFPKGLSKAESVIVFFDKLSKDHKIDTLRQLLSHIKL